jgi:alpha-1,6-mannosyltransferase
MRVPAVLHTGVPAKILATGLLGTFLLAVGGVGAGAVPGIRGGGASAVPGIKDAMAALLHLEWIQRHSGLRSLSAAVVLIGVVLLASAWWQLRPLLHRLDPRALLVVAGLWSLPLLLAPPLFSRDVYAYAGQGHLVANHVDPYLYGPGDFEPKGPWSVGVDAMWRYSPSPYGPVWLWLSGRVVLLAGDHLVPAVILLRLIAITGLLLIAWALPRLALAHGVPPQRALWLGLANPFVLIHGVGGAHNDTVMVGLLVSGLAIAGRNPATRRLVAATVLITVAALVKLPAVAALGFLPMLLPGWGRRLRAAATVGVVSAGAALLLTQATGLGWGWLHSLESGTAGLSIFSPLAGIGVVLGNALQAVGLVQQPDTTTRLVLAAGLAAAGVLALVLLLRSEQVGALRALGLTLVAVVALAPIVQPWYLLWGLVLLAAVGGEKVILALGALSVALCLALLPNGRSLIRPPLYGAPLVAASALAAIEVRRSTRKLLKQAPPVAPPPSSEEPQQVPVQA